MKLWIDDMRPAPEGYVWCKSVNEAKLKVVESIQLRFSKPFIDIDHDAGDYAYDGGDYIKLLDWLEYMNYDVTIHIHSQNPVGVANMRRIIERNGWKEMK